MVKFGGSFVKALGAAALHADRYNMAKLKSTFSEYWMEYEPFGQKMRFEVCRFGECDGSGVVAEDAQDGEGHTMRGVGTRKCACQDPNQ